MRFQRRVTPAQNILVKQELLLPLSQPSTGSVMSPRRKEDGPPRYTCAGSVSTFPLGVCGLPIETPTRDQGHFLRAESAFLRGCLTLVNNIPAFGNTAKAQKHQLKSHYPRLCLHVLL